MPAIAAKGTVPMSTGQTAHVEGTDNIVVQAYGDGLHIDVAHPHLTLIPPRCRIREIRTEIDLLNPYHRAIALVGRERDGGAVRCGAGRRMDSRFAIHSPSTRSRSYMALGA
jgi:hypothetical protein